MRGTLGLLLSFVVLGSALGSRAQDPEIAELPALVPVQLEEQLPPPAPLLVEGPPVVSILEKEGPPPVKLWCGSVEMGINGADGNSDLLKIRAGAKTKRETEHQILTMEAMYAYANANFDPTENRGVFSARTEWPLKATPWSLFTSGQLQFDEFTAWRILLNAHTGVGYQWCKTEKTLLKTRLGAGASREMQGPNNQVKPEALIGAEWDQKIGSRQKICSAWSVFPDMSDWHEFRAEAKVSYEILIDPEWNLTLKLGATNRYISNQPAGKKANDVEYFAVLLWAF